MTTYDNAPPLPDWQLPDRCATSEAAHVVTPPNVILGEN